MTVRAKTLRVIPVTLREANNFIQAHHRHNGRTARDGGKFAIACKQILNHREIGIIIGVAIVGNPISATYMDKQRYGHIAEVLRTCTSPEAPKGTVSFLYGACTRICREMGFNRLISYTLETESGASLKGAGWVNTAVTKPCAPGWRKSDHLDREYQIVMSFVKRRWECHLSNLQLDEVTNSSLTEAL